MRWVMALVLGSGLVATSCSSDTPSPDVEEIPVDVGEQGDSEPVEPSLWATVWQNDQPDIEPGWSEPVMLAVNQDGDWGDSLWVRPDGATIYFLWMPGDPFSVKYFGKGTIEKPPSIYKSDHPFLTREPMDLHFFDEEYMGSGGPMFDVDGNAFYMSNRDSWHSEEKTDQDIFRNDEALPFNNDEMYVNPHYCKAKDQLWFDRDDTEIHVLNQAAENNFNGQPELAPAPINSASDDARESQPWLSEDCETMYFSSTRDGIINIFRSELGANGQWSTPTAVVSGVTYGVGEPSLTQNGVGPGARLFYEQIVFDPEGEVFTTLFFYIEKE